ncbi:MAG TPA: hypothetical protein VG368_02785, partial [Acidimicrobiales bacterium]|nr:hypothetical protein [Acidimicrobiales bacterium]
LAYYRTLAELVWAAVPTRTGGEDSDFSRSHFAITYIMESLAKLTGSVEELVSIKARDLTHAYGYFEIVELYAEEGRFDEALAWAERGLLAFPERTDERLRDVAARELRRAGRTDKAMRLIWRRLEEAPNASSYELLRRHAIAAGSWDGWRERALELLEHLEAGTRSRREASSASTARPRAARSAPRWLDARPESSELVTIFLGEGDPERAWSQAQLGGCSTRLWKQLAALREHDHPDDVIPIYQDEAERAIGTKNNQGYREGVALMSKVRALMDLTGRSDEFPVYAAKLRAAHKPKRNLMKLLDANGW